MTEPMDATPATTLAVVPGSGARASRRGVIPSQTRVVGVIVPPPDVRAIVDKTAQFVAKNGKERGGGEGGGGGKACSRRPLFPTLSCP